MLLKYNIQNKDTKQICGNSNFFVMAQTNFPNNLIKV